MKARSILPGTVSIAALSLAAPAFAQQACPGGNAGLSLSPGFCATVFADNLGHVRHMAVASNGTVYANTWSGRYYNNDTPPPGGMLIALRDTGNSGKADQVQRFGPPHGEDDHGGTGIGIYRDHLYAEVNDRIVRYALPQGGGAPSGGAETVVSGMPLGGDHPMHPFLIDGKGDMYVDMGSATNACQPENRMPGVPGAKPCNELRTRGGTWMFSADKLDQHFSPAQRFATGIRNGEGFGMDSAGRLFVTQHGRDQLYENWPRYYTALEGQNEPAEEVVRLISGHDYGWPECYYNYDMKKLVLAPEYGGNGKTVGVCASKDAPVAAFPGHWAPNDLTIYDGSQFPASAKDGAFVAFHGSWNRAPGAQGGYNVVFQPMANGKASGPFVVFADGFAGAIKQPGRAEFRPTGLAVAPDGALYISDDQKGRIWRVTYQGNKSAPIAAAPAVAPQASASAPGQPPEGMHPAAGLPVPPGGSPDQVALGEQIFHGQKDGGTCSGCHSADGRGTATGADLASGKYLWSDGSVQGIEQTIARGVPKAKQHIGAMPPDGGVKLSQADLAAVTDYVWALGHQGDTH